MPAAGGSDRPSRDNGAMHELQFTLAGRPLGGEAAAFVVAEVAQAHDGSLGMAHAYIDAVADAGADAVKFQTHLAETESTLDEPFRVPPSGQDATRFDYWRRMEFSPDQWLGLAAHAAERGIVFLSSPFSVAAVELLDRVGVPAWKIGSGEVVSEELLDAVVATRKPVLLSSGMSTYAEIGAAVDRCRGGGSDVAVLQATSRYPVAFEEVGLNVLTELRSRFTCPVGLSDHSGTIWPSLAAVTLGAAIVEVHVVFDRRSYGPDVSSSLTIDELGLLVAGCEAISIMRRHPVDKDARAAELSTMRELFSKSVAAVVDLPEGAVLTRESLTTKKPGSGIPPADLNSLIGRRLRHAVRADRLLRWEDVDA